MQELALNAAHGALAGIVYGLLWYSRQRSKDKARNDGAFESFNPYKLGSTVVIGAAIGASVSASGAPIDQASFEQQIVAYTGAISLTEAVLKSAADELGLKS